MNLNNHYTKPKYTIVDAELRDLFAGLIATGLVMTYTDTDHLMEDKEDLAKTAYDLSDALIRRRKINKMKHAEERQD